MSNKVVYGWFDSDECFYIGMGTSKRPYSLSNRNSHCLRKRELSKRNNRFTVKIFYDNLTQEEACEIECQLIQQFGRRDLGTGILTNMTNGGEGVLNFSHTKETKQKIAASKRGKRRSSETIEKMSESLTGKNNPKSKPVVTPKGEFESARIAASVHNIHCNTMYRRLNNPFNPSYKYL